MHEAVSLRVSHVFRVVSLDLVRPRFHIPVPILVNLLEVNDSEDGVGYSLICEVPLCDFGVLNEPFLSSIILKRYSDFFFPGLDIGWFGLRLGHSTRLVVHSSWILRGRREKSRV